ALRSGRRRPAGQPVRRGHRTRPPARLLRRPVDDPARPGLRGAPRRPVRDHDAVRRHRHGRHRRLGEPAPSRLQSRRAGRGGARLMATDLATTFPDELVTRAFVRFVELPLEAGKAALVTLDNGHDHTKPNTLGPGSLAELDRALDTAFAEP